MTYYNEHGVNISKMFESGRSKFFESRSDAQKLADRKRTYIFEVFDGSTSRCNLIGFGVTS